MLCLKRLGSDGDLPGVEMEETRGLTDHSHVAGVDTHSTGELDQAAIRVGAFPQPATDEPLHASVSNNVSQGPLYAYVLDNLG